MKRYFPLSSPLLSPGYCLLQPGYCVVRAGKALGSGAGSALQRLLALFWMLLAAPGWLEHLFLSICCEICIDFKQQDPIVFSFSVCTHFFPSFYFHLPSEGRQGTSVLSCHRMVPAGVSRVCFQRLLPDTVSPSTNVRRGTNDDVTMHQWGRLSMSSDDVIPFAAPCGGLERVSLLWQAVGQVQLLSETKL